MVLNTVLSTVVAVSVLTVPLGSSFAHASEAARTTYNESAASIHKVDSEYINGIEVFFVGDADFVDQNSIDRKEATASIIKNVISVQGDVGADREDPGAPGWEVIRTTNNDHVNQGLQAITTSLKNAFGFLVTLAALRWARGEQSQAAISASAATAAEIMSMFVNYKWTTTKLVKEYSSYHKKYVYKFVVYIYSNSDRTKLEKVTISQPHEDLGNGWLHPL
ncbi:hypothetical protein [Paenibacillus sp. 481]|uniref:hypothetical protein n=1 Tax=Paenibacillus sp. 481 TaxID=2835869 RepID=UPI001E44C0F6|nr:hypothetical protein [Paenibacillus sp. 481]UHA74985.1 hypothetical protein KIK04_08135 [Paenibacillus sp. 481]